MYCVTVAFTNLLPFNGDFSFGKSQKSQGAKSGLCGGWQTWVMWCLAKKACTRAVKWTGALSWWRWSARSVIVNATVTKYTSSVNGVSLPTDYPHRRVSNHGCTVRSPLTGCQITSRPHNWFSRYSKWLDTFRKCEQSGTSCMGTTSEGSRRGSVRNCHKCQRLYQTDWQSDCSRKELTIIHQRSLQNQDFLY